MNVRNRSLLDSIKNYKNTVVEQEYDVFDGLMLCKISGVTFDDRQKNLAAVNKNTPIRLLRDRHNKFDFYAIIVQASINNEWKDVGFIPSNMNKEIAHTLDMGVVLTAKVWQKTGGEGDFYYGLSITIKKKED